MKNYFNYLLQVADFRLQVLQGTSVINMQPVTRNLKLVVILIIFISIFSACDNDIKTNKNEGFSLKTKEDSINYSLGVNIATKIKEEGATNINPEIIKIAINQVYENEDSLLIETEDATKILQTYFGKLHKNKSKQSGIDGKTFLKENSKKKGVVTLESGLQYKIIKQGTGAIPSENDMVVAHFKGKFIDQTVFDNTYDGNPVTFPINKSIKAWQEALVVMPIGSKWELYVSPELAYGSEGSGEVIKPNTVLIYELDLLEIKTPK